MSVEAHLGNRMVQFVNNPALDYTFHTNPRFINNKKQKKLTFNECLYI